MDDELGGHHRGELARRLGATLLCQRCNLAGNFVLTSIFTPCLLQRDFFPELAKLESKVAWLQVRANTGPGWG